MSVSPDLGNRVGAVTQAVAVLAFTCTGGLVSWFAQQARAADLAKAHAARPTSPVVVPRPVQRPVRTVVVRRAVPGSGLSAARPAAPSQSSKGRSSSGSGSVRQSSRGSSGPSARRAAPAPAPAPAQAPAATTSSGS